MDRAINLQQRMNAIGETKMFYRVVAMVAAGMLLDGTDVYLAGAINGAIITTHFGTLAQGSIFLSSGFLGLFVGSIITGFVGDFLGRKQAYQTNLLIFGLFTVFAAFSPNIWILIVLRFIAAIGLGAEIVTGFSLINEFAPIKHRGRWSGLISVIANLSAPMTLCFSAIIIPKFSWRATFIIVGIAALILWVIRHNFPESPRWLISHGHYDQAEVIITKLESGAQKVALDTQDKYKSSSYIGIGIKHGLFVAIISVTAINLVQYTFTSWMPTLLIKQGIDIAHSLTFSALMMAGAPIGALLGTLLVDRIGRKKVIIFGFFMTAIFGLIYANQKQVTGVLVIGFALVTMIYLLMSSIVAVYMSELFPTYFRFRGVGYANGIAKILTVLTPYLVAWALTRINPNLIFYFIAGIAIMAAIVVAVFGPETKKQIIN